MDLEEADQSRPMEMADSFGKKLRGMETQQDIKSSNRNISLRDNTFKSEETTGYVVDDEDEDDIERDVNDENNFSKRNMMQYDSSQQDLETHSILKKPDFKIPSPGKSLKKQSLNKVHFKSEEDYEF